MMHIYLCQFPRLGARAPWSCPGENQYFCSYQPCSCSCSSRPIPESILSIPTTRVGNVPPLSLSGRGRVLVYSTWRSLAFAALKLLPQNAHWRPNRHLKQEKYLHFFSLALWQGDGQPHFDTRSRAASLAADAFFLFVCDSLVARGQEKTSNNSWNYGWKGLSWETTNSSISPFVKIIYYYLSTLAFLRLIYFNQTSLD